MRQYRSLWCQIAVLNKTKSLSGGLNQTVLTDKCSLSLHNDSPDGLILTTGSILAERGEPDFMYDIGIGFDDEPDDEIISQYLISACAKSTRINQQSALIDQQRKESDTRITMLLAKKRQDVANTNDPIRKFTFFARNSAVVDLSCKDMRVTNKPNDYRKFQG